MLCPSIVAINETYHAGTLDLIEIRIKDRPGSMYRPCIAAGNEAYHGGKLDLTHIRIKGGLT
jgi:hypothetical protein